MRFNDRLAVLITKGIGTMWCAYLFAALAFTSLPSALASNNLNVLIQWISQTFLQLVLLSIIMVGQQVMSRDLTELHQKHDRLHHLIHQGE